MKFVLETNKNGYRQGKFLLHDEDKDRATITPMCMLYTKTANAPHIAKDVLHKIQDVPRLMNVSTQHLVEHQEVIKRFKNVSEYAAMKEHFSYCSLYDSSVTNPSGYNISSFIAVWGRKGKISVDVETFMRFQESCRADMYQALSDGDTNQKSSRKRCRRAVDRTLDYLDSCLEWHQTSEHLKDTGIIGTIQGGFDLDERIRSAKETAKRPVKGFCIEGFHNHGPESEAFSLVDVKDILQAVLTELPDDKPRILPGISTPRNVLEAVELGIDVFDSSYPYIVTERGSALVFSFNLSKTEKLEDTSLMPTGENAVVELNLKDARYSDMFEAVLAGCECYTCKTHTKAYVNHLLNTSELLAGTLLMIHNFHHYFQFFKTVQHHIQNDTFQEYSQHFNKLHPQP